MQWRYALIDRQFYDTSNHKRKRTVQLGKRNYNRLLKQSGSAYVTCRNVPVPAKNPNLSKELCTEKCRQNCSAKLSLDQREAIFSAYYSMDYNGKNVLLFNCIQRKDVKSHRKQAQKQKQNTFVYSINVPEQIEPVKLCKTAFCSLFQIGLKRIEVIQKKHLGGEIFDQRGKHNTRANKIPEPVVNEIFNHFDVFAMESAPNVSDASNDKPKRKRKKIRKPILTVKQMYDHYIGKCKLKGLSDEYFVKYGFYAHVFYRFKKSCIF